MGHVAQGLSHVTHMLTRPLNQVNHPGMSHVTHVLTHPFTRRQKT